MLISQREERQINWIIGTLSFFVGLLSFLVIFLMAKGFPLGLKMFCSLFFAAAFGVGTLLIINLLVSRASQRGNPCPNPYFSLGVRYVAKPVCDDPSASGDIAREDRKRLWIITEVSTGKPYLLSISQEIRYPSSEFTNIEGELIAIPQKQKNGNA